MVPQHRRFPRIFMALGTPPHVWFAWLFIGLCISLYFIPYCLPGNTPNTLGSYPSLSIIPVIVATVLRARKGSRIATAIVLGILAFWNTFDEGFPWSDFTFKSWVIGGTAEIIIGFVIGQFTYMRQQLLLKNRLLLDTHLELQTSHEALSDAYDEVKCLEEELRTNNETLNQVNVQLVELARVDPLTRVLNHRALMDTLERELAHARRHKRACGIMLFDIDHFKALNDGYGHPAGDVILQEFIRIAQGTLRAGDSTGRWGGEEFIVILPDTDATEALMVAERLRATIARHMFHVGGGIHLTCSVGVAVFPEHANARASLLAAADMAVYAAKQLGRDQVRVVHDTAVQAVESRKDANGSRDEQAFLGIIKALSDLLAARDGYTGAHTSSVGKLAVQMALALGLEPAEARMIEAAGQLHDIGKVAIPDSILQKPGKLTEEEWALMRQHPRIGAEIVSNVPALRPCVAAIRAHHERWDGEGYPDGLACEAIPLGARIIAVVDTFDAITTDRPYRQAQNAIWALAELRRCAGTQFDPLVVETLARIIEAADDTLRQAA